ncbi:MAG: M20/M25/M40 family metallo-hydrolase [Gemmatimonadota bacterium]|nr:M20/M25/M40 family metallo-hydrolase [Gemmatimonadota bacterium]
MVSRLRPFSRAALAAVASAALLACIPAPSPAQQPASLPVARYRDAARRIIAAAMADTLAYSRLATMTDTYGSRLSGSPGLERAINWVLARMQDDSLTNVRGEPVMVPHWVRGAESATLVSPRAWTLHMLGLGGSVGTPPGGITAPVLVVNSFDDLAAHAAEAKGRIVLFDSPFPTDVPPMEGYRRNVAYRGGAASAAARVGAVAALIRSVTPHSQQTPHTGSLRYADGVPEIPSAALSVEDAELLHRMQDRGEPVVVTLKMQARTLPDVPSRNVVAELRGSEQPDQVVVLGGHIDSWDVGEGAMDDAGGAFAAWEAVRIIKALGLRPRRTLRVVMWVNEENGGRGGRAYRDQHLAELPNTVAAMESDNGVFRPDGFRFQGTPAGLDAARQIGSLLAGMGAGTVTAGDGEADVGPIVREGVPGFALNVDDATYFWYHHTDADMMTVINRDDFRRCIAAMAVMAYVLADLPDPLPRHP